METKAEEVLMRRPPTINVSVIILTFNAEATLPATLSAAMRVSDDVHVVDSFSTDRTLEIARSLGAHGVQHPFENYGAQRNWASDHLPLKYAWELHLDADERLSEELIREIHALQADFPAEIDGYFMPRVTRFMGRIMRRGGVWRNWHMRLFRHGRGRCERRLYDQHFYVQGRAEKLRGLMVDDIQMPLKEWVERHNRWAEAEVGELISPTRAGVVRGRFLGNPVERKRALRGLYNRLPLFLRAFLFFAYRYFLRLGFLDGPEGLIYHALQGWFRFLVDAKLYERRRLTKIGR